MTLGPVEGTSLMIRRALHASKETESQQEQIFHTRCFVQGKVCSLIIDVGSETNVFSQTMIHKLNHKVIKHPHSYKLYWLNNGNVVNVDKQALFTISFGDRNVDNILCDVLPMDACHILLGRPWQHDKSTFHDGRKTLTLLNTKTNSSHLPPYPYHLKLKLHNKRPTLQTKRP